MNRKTGMIAALVTLAGVLGFALCMLADSLFGCYLSSMFIAWGFVPMICAFAAFGQKDTRAAGYAAITFAAIYTVFIMLTYFTQLTTIRNDALTAEAVDMLNYTRFGWLFNLDMLGYSFMALAGVFAALTIDAQTSGDKWLKGLLLAHGVFAVVGVVLPILGVFSADMPEGSGDWIGIIINEFWCLYFTPVCILSFLHFERQPHNS